MAILINSGDRSASGRTWLPTESQSPVLSREQFDAVSMRVYNRANQTDHGMSAYGQVGRWALGTGIDTLDTMWSTPLNPWGERGDIWKFASDDEKAYYERHKSLIEGSSAVAGGILTMVAAEALLIPRLTQALGSSTFLTGTRLWQAGKAWNVESKVQMLASQRLAAESGEAYGLFSSAAGRSFVANRAVSGVAATTRTMPIEYALMWNNDSFNSGDWSKEGFWIGVGAVLGGTVGGIGARAVARKSANSMDIRDIRAAPMALAGVSNDLLSSTHLQTWSRINPDTVALKESARTTEFLLASRSANPTNVVLSPTNATKLHKLRDVNKGLAVDSIQKLISKGITGVDTVKIPYADLPEVRYIVEEVGKVDPFVFHGLSEMGVLRTSVDEARTSRANFITSLDKQSKLATKKKKPKEAARLARLHDKYKHQDDFVMVNGTWLNPVTDLAKAAIQHDPKFALARYIMPVKGTEGLKIATPSRTMTIDASLSPRDIGGGLIDVATMGLKDRFVLDEAAGVLVKKLSAKNAPATFNLTDAGAKNWYSLDLAAEILQRDGRIQFGMTGKMRLASLEDIQRESVRMKAKAVLSRVGITGKITPEMRFRYNLPGPTPMELIDDPAGDGFKNWLIGAMGKQGTTRELADALGDARAIQGVDLLVSSGAPPLRIDGNTVGFNRDAKGTWMRPLMGYFDQPNHIEKIMNRGHASALTLHKAEKTAILLSSQTHVSALANNIVVMPELVPAMDVRGLSSDQITGTGGGIGQFFGELLPRRFRVRDNLPILNATKLQETTERHGLATFKVMMDSVGMQGIVSQVTSTGNSAKLAMLDQYFSLRSGWDVDDTVSLGKGMFGFKLKDTKANRSRLKLSKNAVWADELLMNERLKTPVVVDADALSVINQTGKLFDTLLEADNVLRTAKSQVPVNHRKFYTPPPNTKGALVGFVFGPDNKVVPGRTITARSHEEYNSVLDKTLKDLEKEFGKGSGHTIRTRDQQESLRDIWDEAQMDWIDPGYSSATAGIGSQTGGLTGAYVKQGAFLEALEWVKRKTVAQSQDTLRQIMDDSLIVARMQGAAERVVTPAKTRNIYDEYEMALTGRSEEYSDSAIIDRILRKTEESIDRVLANTSAFGVARSAVVTPARWYTDTAQRMGMNPTVLGKSKTYDEIVKVMGPYTPFANATEFLESRGIKRPPTVRGMASTLNTMAASVLLRWFEVPHAAMNLLGLIATIPATTMGGRAPISTFVKVKGQDIGFIDGTRIIAGAMKDMFSKGKSADWDQMVKMGDSGQSVMEYHKQLGSIESQAGWNKWAAGADKYASILTDTTENWSRQVSHFVGLRLADHHGITGMAARHDFAREVANAAIADYAPINRPELFSSGFGSMIGLFQSYALNHYTKMFRWMENGQFKEAGLQAGMQAAMFGLPGTYSIGHLLDLRDSTLATGSDPTAVDLIYEHFGPVLGGAIAHGGVSELTELALWTRGDMNFRVPGVSGSLPAYDIGTKVARGFVDSVSAFMNAMPGEAGHAVLEVVQREMPNRILRSWLTILNSGQEIDAYGQVMAETRGWLDVTARVIGVRSRRQQAELEAYYSGKGAMERDASKMESLRESYRSAVRNNSGNPEAVNPIQYFNDYVKAGGNPRMFKTWARTLLRESDSSRAAQQLRKQLMTPRSALETWRYGAYGAWDIDE